MSINPISTASSIPTQPQEDFSSEEANTKAKLSAEEAHKLLIDTNTKYIFDQMIASNRRFTQEMIRSAKEQQDE